MRTRFIPPLLLLFFIMAVNARAQISAGAICSGAATIIPGSTAQTINQSGNSGWLKFTASSANMTLRIKNQFTGVNAGRITNVNVYSGNCTTPVLIYTDTLDSGNDTTLHIGLSGITASQDYYIETIKNTFPGQCDKIIDCSGDAVFTLEYLESMVPICTVISWYKSSTNCHDTISNNRSCVAHPCDYGEIPLCYTPVNNTLSISAGFTNGGIYTAFQSFDMDVYTTGSPSNYTVGCNSGTLASFPFLAVGPGPVTYTINVYNNLGGPL